jgi:hypothetical protein
VDTTLLPQVAEGLLALTITVTNLDYPLLIVDMELRASFELAIVRTMITWLQTGSVEVVSDNITLTLSQGSVLILTEALLPGGIDGAAVLGILSLDSLVALLASSLAEIQGLAVIANGQPSVFVAGASGGPVLVTFGEEALDDYSSPWLCPLGVDGVIDCAVQQPIIVSFLVLLCCCATCAMCCCFGRFLPPDDDKPRKGWRKWCRFVYRLVKVLFPPRVEGSERLQGVRTRYSIKKNESEKTRVIWDASSKQFDELGFTNMDDWQDGACSKTSRKVKSRDQPPASDNTLLGRPKSHGVRTPASGSSTKASLISIYGDGDSVEYFSLRNQQWLIGTVRVTAKGHEVRYDVQLPRGGHRRINVALDLLRPPLISGERVECGPLTPIVNGIVDVGADPQWQRGIVKNPEFSRATITDYLVMLEGGRGSATVPSAQVRRHFPPGAFVQVYRGATQGWTDAEVLGGFHVREYDRADVEAEVPSIAASNSAMSKVPSMAMSHMPSTASYPMMPVTSSTVVPSSTLTSVSFQRVLPQPAVGTQGRPLLAPIPAGSPGGRRLGSSTPRSPGSPRSPWLLPSDVVGHRSTHKSGNVEHRVSAETPVNRVSTRTSADASNPIGPAASEASVQNVASAVSNGSTSASSEAPPWAILPVRAMSIHGAGDACEVEWFPAFLMRNRESSV